MVRLLKIQPRRDMGADCSDVKVFVRTRPTANFAKDLIEYNTDGQTMNAHLRKDSSKGVVNNQLSSWTFRFNQVLHDASQEEVYSAVARDVVLGTLDGYNGTVMCFGQTGAGKTYTMTGANANYELRGIIPRALQEVFREVEQRSDHDIKVHLSFLEIYNETLLDLLSSHRKDGGSGGLSIVEEVGGGVSVRGLSEHLVHNEEEALNLHFEGEMNRIIGAHAQNRRSSRSHCIFSVRIESRSRTLSEAGYTTSKLNLVDLAGSERLGKTGSEGRGLKEATYINKSLSFLEQAILALADRHRDHVPFRQCKLTHALSDSLGGNCKTVLVANVYGEAAHIKETLSTLRFATRMKRVKTRPYVNEHVDPVIQVRKLEKEIQLLKQELSIHDTLANRTGVSYKTLTEAQVTEIQSQVRRYLDGTVDEIDIVSIRQVQEVFAQFRLALQHQEQKVRDDLRENHSLVEKTPDAAAESRGTMVSVGEVEGCGFGVGEAPLSERYTGFKSTRKTKPKKGKDSSEGRRGEGSISLEKEAEVLFASPTNPLLVSARDLESLSQSKRPDMAGRERSGTCSPPPKEEAFEVFKVERGCEFYRILRENQTILLAQRRCLKELSQGLNAVKQQIDCTSASLQHWTEKNQRRGELVSTDGQPLMEEAELSLVLKLRELKTQYRQQYEELRSTKAQINYCVHLVDQCRTRLLVEFERWYNQSFLVPDEVQAVMRSGDPIRPGLISVDKALALKEEEPVEHLPHQLRADSPGAASYYNAYHRTVQRRNHGRAMSQTPLQRTDTGRSGRIKLPAIVSVRKTEPACRNVPRH